MANGPKIDRWADSIWFSPRRLMAIRKPPLRMVNFRVCRASGSAYEIRAQLIACPWAEAEPKKNCVIPRFRRR